MKTTKKPFVWMILGVLLFALIAGGVSVCIIRRSRRPYELKDINVYKKGDYSDLTGGEVVKDYLLPYEDAVKMADSEDDIAFYYLDAARNSFFHRYFTSYVIEMKCSNNFDNAIASFEKDPEEEFKPDSPLMFSKPYRDMISSIEDQSDEEWEDGFNYFTLSSDKTPGNALICLAYNRQTSIIRYAVFYGRGAKKVDPASMFSWNTDLSW